MPDNNTNKMLGINPYGKELESSAIDNGTHRNFIGGMWEELGQLQFEFLRSRGLLPRHKLVDIGCGCLRGGIHFARYLDSGNYYGLDINESLIRAGHKELEIANLQHKDCHLLVDDKFKISRFQTEFDFMISVSVFTHLPMNSIIRCLDEVRQTLTPAGVYYATFFEAPNSAHLEIIHQTPIDNIITHYDSDPFHYSFEEIQLMSKLAGLQVDLIGEWNHPRNQRMLAFRH